MSCKYDDSTLDMAIVELVESDSPRSIFEILGEGLSLKLITKDGEVVMSASCIRKHYAEMRRRKAIEILDKDGSDLTADEMRERYEELMGRKVSELAKSEHIYDPDSWGMIIKTLEEMQALAMIATVLPGAADRIVNGCDLIVSQIKDWKRDATRR